MDNDQLSITNGDPSFNIEFDQRTEAFEICEYGNRPSRENILRLFPMMEK